MAVASMVAEMEIAEGLGLSRAEVLRQDLQVDAELWEWRDVGKVEVGAIADVILVNGDPTGSGARLSQGGAMIAG